MVVSRRDLYPTGPVEDSESVVYLINIHPTLTWKDDFKEGIKVVIKKVDCECREREQLVKKKKNKGTEEERSEGIP